MPMPNSCRERGHMITSWRDMRTCNRVFRHGDNPEHVLMVEEYEIATLPWVKEVRRDTLVYAYLLHKLILWTDRIHEYEDAAQRQPEPRQDRRGEGEGGEG